MATLAAVLVGDTTFVDAVAAGDITIEGDASALLVIFGNLDQSGASFHIVEP